MAAADSKLDSVLARGKLIVGTGSTNAPWHFQGADGKLQGFDIDIARMVAEATGARHAYFGHDEWEPFAPGLKTLEDATTLRRRILVAFERAERETDPAKRAALLTFVIIGAGPTGVELAGTIAELAQQANVKLEHGTNLVKHGSGGELIVRVPEGPPAVELLALIEPADSVPEVAVAAVEHVRHEGERKLDWRAQVHVERAVDLPAGEIDRGEDTPTGTLHVVDVAVADGAGGEIDRDEIEIRRGFKENIWDPAFPPPPPLPLPAGWSEDDLRRLISSVQVEDDHAAEDQHQRQALEPRAELATVARRQGRHGGPYLSRRGGDESDLSQ